MNAPEKSGWDNYRAWRKTLWISVTTASGLAVIASRWPSHWGDYLPILPAVAAFLSSNALQHYRCPRCDRSFFYNHTWLPWEGNCRHCDLPKWQEADYVAPDTERTAGRILSVAEMTSDVSVSQRERDSKFLLLVLREDPGAIHLPLDSDGWADIQNLLTRANRYGFKLTLEGITDAVALSPTSRFEWDQPGNRIRVVVS